MNPCYAVKNRPALRLVEEAEHYGRIQPGGTFCEATSGNTGIGVAQVCAAKGYKVIATLPEK